MGACESISTTSAYRNQKPWLKTTPLSIEQDTHSRPLSGSENEIRSSHHLLASRSFQVKEKIQMWKEKDRQSKRTISTRVSKNSLSSPRSQQSNSPRSQSSIGALSNLPGRCNSSIGYGDRDTSQSLTSFTSASDTSFRPVRELRIAWSDIIIDESAADQCLIGRGSFVVVIRAIWRRNTRDIEVAVKLRARSNFQGVQSASIHNNIGSYEDACKSVWKEVGLVKEAELEVANSECIVRAYGVCEGAIPNNLANLLNLPDDEEAVGIVMRYESGGSIESLLHSSEKHLPLYEKIRMLKCVAQALHELHSANLIHGNVKPSNVLLTHHNPPEVRIADFGKSVGVGSRLELSIHVTQSLSGDATSVYRAPEIIFNPENESFNGPDAKISPCVDMYSFAILCWEVLSRKRPAENTICESAPTSPSHRYQRPSKAELPVDTPFSILSMIEACWNKDPDKRLTSAECTSVLLNSLDTLSAGVFDIFLSHTWTMKPLLSQVYLMLTRLGYRVWYDQCDMGHDLVESMKRGISSSRVVVACLNRSYQNRANCMFELRSAAGVVDHRAVIALVTDPNPLTWASAEVRSLCQLETRMYVDVSKVAEMKWDSDAGPTIAMQHALRGELELLLRLLNDLGCQPSMTLQQSAYKLSSTKHLLSSRKLMPGSSSLSSLSPLSRHTNLSKSKSLKVVPGPKLEGANSFSSNMFRRSVIANNSNQNESLLIYASTITNSSPRVTPPSARSSSSSNVSSHAVHDSSTKTYSVYTSNASSATSPLAYNSDASRATSPSSYATTASNNVSPSLQTTSATRAKSPSTNISHARTISPMTRPFVVVNPSSVDQGTPNFKPRMTFTPSTFDMSHATQSSHSLLQPHSHPDTDSPSKTQSLPIPHPPSQSPSQLENLSASFLSRSTSLLIRDPQAQLNSIRSSGYKSSTSNLTTTILDKSTTEQALTERTNHQWPAALTVPSQLTRKCLIKQQTSIGASSNCSDYICSLADTNDRTPNLSPKSTSESNRDLHIPNSSSKLSSLSNRGDSTCGTISNNAKNGASSSNTAVLKLKPHCPGKKVMVRAKPSIHEDPVAYIKSGQTVEVYPEMVQGFYKLTGCKGFVYSKTSEVTWVPVAST